MKYGYARISTLHQALEAQLQALEKEGCDKIYSDKFTGTKTDRPNFNKLLQELKESDTLEFNQIKNEYEEEYPKLLKKNNNARLSIRSERDVLQDAKDAHKNAFVRQMTTLGYFVS